MESGILNLEELDDAGLTPGDVVRLLFTLSRHCAGIGAFVRYTLAGEMLKKRYASGQVPKGPVGIGIGEEADIDIEHGSPDFQTRLAGGTVRGTKKSVLMAGDAALYAVFAKGDDGDYLVWVDAGADAVETAQPVGLLGIRAVRCADVAFEAAPALAAVKVGPGEGAGALSCIVALLGLFNAACASGTANAGLGKAWEYAGQRYQGGRLIEGYDAIRLMYTRNAALTGAS